MSAARGQSMTKHWDKNRRKHDLVSGAVYAVKALYCLDRQNERRKVRCSGDSYGIICTGFWCGNVEKPHELFLYLWSVNQLYNDIIKIGFITVHSYGLMIAIGILCAIIVASKRAEKRNLDSNIIYNLAFIALIFGFVGAKLLYCIVEIEEMLNNPLQAISGSGFVVYGGIVGGILAVWTYCHIRKISFLNYLDLMIPSVAIAQGFGRIGCLLAGCCYGRETDWAIGIIFHNSTIAPNGIRLFPTQIVSSIGDFAIAFLLLIYAKKERKAGKVGALYLMLYSAGRFMIEFLRSDYRGSVGILSTSQLIALIIFAVGIVMFSIDKFPRRDKEKAHSE